jgi:hypothetical protein
VTLAVNQIMDKPLHVLTGTIPARLAFLVVVGHVNSGRRAAGMPGNSLSGTLSGPASGAVGGRACGN